MKYYLYGVLICGYYSAPVDSCYHYGNEGLKKLFIMDAELVISMYDVHHGYKASDLEISQCGEYGIIIYPKEEPEKATIVSIGRKTEYND